MEVAQGHFLCWQCGSNVNSLGPFDHFDPSILDCDKTCLIEPALTDLLGSFANSVISAVFV